MKKKLKRAAVLVLSAAVALLVFPVSGIAHVSAAEPVVIAIDPGHGGSNLGTDYLPIPEKHYNMAVALYMKEALEQYQGVEVYLTHTEDIDTSFQERAELAVSVNADFLISLHFNTSLSHILYGSEVWVPSSGRLYSQGYAIGNEFLLQFSEMGLFSRGIKTRIGSKGTDYYAIIRECADRNIPGIIVEHCHVDHANDSGYIRTQEQLKEFGVRDARAVARYFGLDSKDGRTDYSGYAPLAVPVPASRVHDDTTAPVYAAASLINYDKTRKYAAVRLTAFDGESPIQYYSYSCDNGVTWSVLQPWDIRQAIESCSNSVTVAVNLGYGQKSSLVFKVYNLYDKSTQTNVLTLN